jgi:hypothetical protein
VDVGSVAAGAWIARLVFLILVGWALFDGKRGVAAVAVLLGAGVWLAVPRLNPQLVTPCLAVIDIGLVFSVIGRDIRLN